MANRTNDEEFVSVVREIFSEKIPFIKVLGLKVESLSYERVRVSFQMRDELMGNYKRGMLHGGVISSVIDAVGGLAALMGAQERMRGKTLATRLEKLERGSTIDLRVDFLRPGMGKWFVATAYALKTGNKIVVTRIELNNDQDDLVAIGTCSYFVA